MSNEPTELTTVVGLADITEVADVVIDGDLLWVTPGVTPDGRFWAFTTPAGIAAGLITEQADGTFCAAIGWASVLADSSHEAALAVVAALRGQR